MLGENRVWGIVSLFPDNRGSGRRFAGRLTRTRSDEVNGLLARIGRAGNRRQAAERPAALYDSLTEASDNLASLLANLESTPAVTSTSRSSGAVRRRCRKKAERKPPKLRPGPSGTPVKELKIKN